MNLQLISYQLLLYTLIFLFNEYGVTNAQTLRICVVESTYKKGMINKTCPIMDIPRFECSVARDRFDCLRKLANNEADVASLQAEDLLAVSMNKFDFLTTFELRLFTKEKYEFEMVALVRKNIDSEWDLKGKRFCHPGFEISDTYTKSLSMYFENRIIPKECDPEKTLLENRLTALSNYFEAACIAGPWIDDAALDKKLKKKYKNLCSLCYNPASCSIGDKYHGRDGAILCLTDNVGDIAWVRLDDVVQYFKMTESNKDDYSYLCPDGMTRPAKDDNPCIWLQQPWPVIVSPIKIAETAVDMINLTINRSYLWKNAFYDVLSFHSTFILTETFYSPIDYLERSIGFLSANDRATCKPSRRVSWCISSNIEDRKCRWLRDASFVYGIEPSISCIQESNRMSCLDAVRNQEADIFVSKPEELLQVFKKEMKPILQVTTNQEYDIKIVAIVKRNSLYKSIKDLKGANACFTGYQSIGWNTFVTIMKMISKENGDCSDIKAVGNFFSHSCVPGLSTMKTDIPRNLYSLCRRDVNVENDINTFSCLTSGRADVVFVNLNNIKKEFNITNLGNEKYKILCKEETTQKETEEACLLTRITSTAIVAHQNITDLRRDEIYSMFLHMNQLFGTTTTRYTRAFSLYGPYDGVENVIFPEGSERIQLEVNKIHRIPNYEDIIKEMINSTCSSSAHHFNSRFDQIYLLGLLILIVIFTFN